MTPCPPALLLLAVLPLAAAAVLRRYEPIDLALPRLTPRWLAWAAEEFSGPCWQVGTLALFAAAALAGVVTPASLGFVPPGGLGDDGEKVALLLLGCAALAPRLVEALLGATPGAPGHAGGGGEGPSLGGLVGSCLLAPFAEEAYFRGLLFPLLSAPLGPPAAAALSSAAFAAVHDYGAAGRVSVFCFGLTAAWLTYRTGSLWPAVALHAATNCAVQLRCLVSRRLRPEPPKEAA